MEIKITSTKQCVPNEASQAAENSGLKNMLVVPRENMLCISSLETGCLPRINEKPSLRKSSYPLLRQGRGEADTLVYDALQLPPGSGERWLHLPVPPFCPREGLHTLPSVSPSRSLGPVAMGSPRSGWRNTVPLTSDTGPLQAANLLSFLSPPLLSLPF